MPLMADKEGRGGGAGLFVVGLLIGVAGTLITQRFVQSGGENARSETMTNSSTPVVSAQPASGVKPKLVTHQGGLSGAHPASAAAAAVNDQSPSDVADDAAAAGMTSRTPRPPSNAGQ
jgi:hypothetical protein